MSSRHDGEADNSSEEEFPSRVSPSPGQSSFTASTAPLEINPGDDQAINSSEFVAPPRATPSESATVPSRPALVSSTTQATSEANATPTTNFVPYAERIVRLRSNVQVQGYSMPPGENPPSFTPATTPYSPAIPGPSLQSPNRSMATSPTNQFEWGALGPVVPRRSMPSSNLTSHPTVPSQLNSHWQASDPTRTAFTVEILNGIFASTEFGPNDAPVTGIRIDNTLMALAWTETGVMIIRDISLLDQQLLAAEADGVVRTQGPDLTWVQTRRVQQIVHASRPVRVNNVPRLTAGGLANPHPESVEGIAHRMFSLARERQVLATRLNHTILQQAEELRGRPRGQEREQGQVS